MKTKKITKKSKTAAKVAKAPLAKGSLDDYDRGVLRVIRQNKAKGLLRADVAAKAGVYNDVTLTLALRKLKEQGLVRSEGETRATRWFPVA